MRLSSILSSLAAAFALLACASGASAACTASTTATGTVTYSPNAAVAATPSFAGGFGCSGGAALTLFGSNYLKATISNANSYKLTKSGAPDLVYTLSANASGSVQLSGTTAYYINGATLDVLGLTGSIPASVPIYIKPTTLGAVKSGVYTGAFRVTWEWWFCPSVSVGNACIGLPDTGTKATDVTLSVTINGGTPATVTTTTTLVYDDQNSTTNPKSIPGSKQRTTATVSNPDTSALASNTMELKIPTPTGSSVSLDGDGGGGAFAIFTEGSPASGLAFSYVASNNSGDDVEFSSDGGSTWTFQPTAATQAQVTHVRLKPRGAMAAGSNFKLSVAYTVK
uniref:hypothetical protein n=1 Tax=uncultured Caulobacter sp. TaxID=158749 RepID=UPI0025F03757|nr:hypothetical protein [uncultured Caulobacter sp.]